MLLLTLDGKRLPYALPKPNSAIFIAGCEGGNRIRKTLCARSNSPEPGHEVGVGCSGPKAENSDLGFEQQLEMKIIFVTDQHPLSPRDDERFGLEILTGEGHQVFHWNVSRITGSKYDRVEVPPGSRACRREVNNMQELRYLLRTLRRGDMVVCADIAGISHLRVLRAVGQSAAYFTALSVGNIPQPDDNYGCIRAIMKTLYQFRIKPDGFARAAFVLLVRTGLLTIFLRTLGFSSLDTIWAGCSVENSVLRALSDSKTTVHFIHNFDYDRILSLKENKNPIISEPYFLVLGGLGPMDPNYRSMGQESLGAMLPVGAWNLAMNDALDAIAEKTKLKAVVALHPRGTDRDLEHIYTRQTVFRNKTPELVRDATFVLTFDGSTAISFAVMLSKPLVFAAWEHLGTEAEINRVRWSAGLLGAKIVAGSKDSIDHVRLSVDVTRYRNYAEKYVKKARSVESRPFWNVVLELTNKELNGGDAFRES